MSTPSAKLFAALGWFNFPIETSLLVPIVFGAEQRSRWTVLGSAERVCCLVGSRRAESRNICWPTSPAPPAPCTAAANQQLPHCPLADTSPAAHSRHRTDEGSVDSTTLLLHEPS